MVELKELFTRQKDFLLTFFDRVDFNKVEEIISTILDCKGMIFFSGVGKSGIIAEKLAMTMISTGTKAMYVPPTNALHGDIGIVSREDVFIMLSKSGETQELINLIPYLNQRKVKTVAWVSDKQSRLAKICDLSIELYVEKELCPFDLAPTTSTAIQLIFGDIIAVAIMERKNFSLQDYAKNHPSGDIGKRMLKVEDIMIDGDKVPLCHIKDKLKDCLVELTNKRCGCLIVTDDHQKIQGIFTDGDLRRAMQKNSTDVLEEMMENLMTKTFLSIPKTYYVHEALSLMQSDSKKWVMVLPVTDKDKLIGLVRMHDAVHLNL